MPREEVVDLEPVAVVPPLLREGEEHVLPVVGIARDHPRDEVHLDVDPHVLVEGRGRLEAEPVLERRQIPRADLVARPLPDRDLVQGELGPGGGPGAGSEPSSFQPHVRRRLPDQGRLRLRRRTAPRRQQDDEPGDPCPGGP